MITRFRAHVVRPICEHLAARGVPVAPLLREAGLPADAATQPFIEVPLASLHAFHEAAARAAKEPLLGAKVGLGLSLQTWDVLQLSARSAATLGEALQRFPGLIKLFNTWVDIEVTPGETWKVCHRIAGEPLGLSRQGNELWVATLLQQLRLGTGRAVAPLRVWFGHPRHRQAAQLQQLLDAPSVDFAAGSSGLELAASDAALPLVTADPVAFSVLERLTDQALSSQGPQRGTAALVYQALRGMLRGRVPAVGRVAKELAMSPRSLQRALEAEGTSYRALVDHVRRDLAGELQARGVPLAEAADRLGYADTDSLRRARGRWAAAG